MQAGVDALEDGVVESVEGFEAQLDPGAMLVERDCLEEREVPVEDTRSESRVLAGCTEALVSAACPRSQRIGVGSLREPSRCRLRISDLGNQVRPVGSAGQAKHVWSGIGDEKRHTGFCDRDAGDGPATDGVTLQHAAVGTEGQVIDVTGVEDMTAVESGIGSAVISGVE